MRKATHMVTAAVVGRQFDGDPNLVVPARPRLPPEILVLPFAPDGLLFVGTEHMQLIRGVAARTTLPPLLRLMDGQRGLEDIARVAPGLGPPEVRDIVALLCSRGLLEDGRPPTPRPGLEDVDAFLGRFLDVTRVNRNRGEALDRLAEASVLLAGSSDGVDLMAAQLRGCGIGRVRLARESAPGGDRHSLVVVVVTRDRDDPTTVIEAARLRGEMVFLVVVGRSSTQIGPLFVDRSPGCYRCVSRAHARPRGNARPTATAFWTALAALQAVNVLGHVACPPLHGGLRRYRLGRQGLTSRFYYVAGVPGCAACGLQGRRLSPAAPAFSAWVLHRSTSPPPYRLRNLRAHQEHYRPHNLELTAGLSEPYYGSQVHPLPTPLPLNAPAPWVSLGRPTSLRLPQLSTLLHYGAGYEDRGHGRPRRLAPSGGGLESPELFVIARRIPGLRAGLYRYHAPRHVLERLPETSPVVLSVAMGSADLPAWAIVGTAHLGRVERKYRGFAYRLVHLDAGIVLGYLRDVGSTLGLRLVHYHGLQDDALIHALRLPQAAAPAIRGAPTLEIRVARSVHEVSTLRRSSRNSNAS